jgi:hypothetical protein
MRRRRDPSTDDALIERIDVFRWTRRTAGGEHDDGDGEESDPHEAGMFGAPRRTIRLAGVSIEVS